MMTDWEKPEYKEFLEWWRGLSDDERKLIQKEVHARARAGSADFKQQVRLNIWRKKTGRKEEPIVVYQVVSKPKIDEVVIDANQPP